MTIKPVSLPVSFLDVIHQWLPFKPGLLYPFPVDDKEPGGRTEAQLSKSGFLSSDSRISDKAKRIFSVIAEAEQTLKLRFLVDGDLLDYQLFFSKDKKSSASLKRSDDRFDANSPAPTDDIIDLISDFSGMSSFGVIDAHWLLSFSESVVMAAIVDAIRKQIFASLADFETSFAVKLSSDSIREILNSDRTDSQWLTWVLSSFIPQELDIASIEVEDVIEALCKKELLKLDGSNLVPRDDIILLARRLLHLSCLYMVDSFSVKSEDEGEKSRFAVVQNGVRDLLMLETDGQSIAWQGISGKVLLSLLQNLFSTQAEESNTSAKKIKTTSRKSKGGRFVPKSDAKNTSLVCPDCNKSLKPNAKFCTGCGKTL